MEASLLLGAGSDLSVHNNWIQSAVPIYWGRMKKNKNKVFFSQKNMKQKEKTIFKDQFVVAATPGEDNASDQPCLQPPGEKLSINNGEVRVGEHQD